MDFKFSKREFEERISKFVGIMNKKNPDWDSAFIINKVNQYYYTGTMQDGVLVILKNGEYGYFVRRSIDRAKYDSELGNIYSINSYRDISNVFGSEMGNAYFELNVMPAIMLERFKKSLKFNSINAVDGIILGQRAVKSNSEIEILRYCGKQHLELMENVIPYIMKAGMTENQFVTDIYVHMMELGFQGMPRYNMFQIENHIGQIAFGVNSLMGSSFDGPGGSLGMYAAAPFGGNNDRKLQSGDLVFVDIGFAVGGYHTDKTQIYSFDKQLPPIANEIHKSCMDMQAQIAKQLKVGNIPGEIYNSQINNLPENLKTNFMGFGERTVKFLGHGIGLCIDEMPVIANGFNQPLEKNMVIAIEPKCGVAGIGAVGVEDTYIVTESGGECITGGGVSIITVK